MTHLHVKKLEDMIDYSKEGVNKEYLLETENGKVKLVAFKKGEEIPSHTAPGKAMVYVLEGEIKFYITHEGECECNDCGCTDTECLEHEIEIKKGEFLRFHKEEEHRIRAEKDTKLLIVHL